MWTLIKGPMLDNDQAWLESAPAGVKGLKKRKKKIKNCCKFSIFMLIKAEKKKKKEKVARSHAENGWKSQGN